MDAFSLTMSVFVIAICIASAFGAGTHEQSKNSYWFIELSLTFVLGSIALLILAFR